MKSIARGSYRTSLMGLIALGGLAAMLMGYVTGTEFNLLLGTLTGLGFLASKDAKA